MYIAIRSKEDCSEALEAARRYSPNIEIVDETTLVFDLTGGKAKDAGKIARELRQKFEAVAVSENLAAALLLARWGRERRAGGREGGCVGVRECEQTQNSKPKTQNLLQEAFKADKSEYRAGPLITSGAEFNARADKGRRKPLGKAGEREGVKAGGRENGCLSEQTQNPKLKTQNSPSTLSRLPIDAISQKQEFLELMDSWAIHDLGSFAELPGDGMVERFGQEIIELRKQAAGEAFRAPNWNVKEDKFFWAKELEGAIETIEPLNFVLSKGVEQIFQNLDYAGLSTQSAKITLRGREKNKVYRIRIVFPTKNQKLWIRQIVTKIELDTPVFNIDRVEIEFRSTKPRTVQNNLYSGVILEPENLNLIVTKLKKVVGLSKIGLPKLRDSWSEQFYMTEDLSSLIAEEKFKVQSSKFNVRNTEAGAKEASSGEQTQDREESIGTRGHEDAGSGGSGVRECERAGEVSSFRFQVSGLSKQTQNPKPKTQNSLSTRREGECVGVRECERGGDVSGFRFQVSGLSKQTRNPKPKTQNTTEMREQEEVQSSEGSESSVISHQLSVISSVFYYLPQPVRARVFFESGEPKALIIKGKRELVRMSGGPWRKDAEWYRAPKWQRDEWDIETETGAVYRVFTDRNGEAFVDGGYD